jgi:hypothetical protein
VTIFILHLTGRTRREISTAGGSLVIGRGRDGSTTHAYNLYHRLDYTFAMETFLSWGDITLSRKPVLIRGTETLAKRSKAIVTGKKY